MIVTVTPNGSVDTVLRRIGSPDEEEQQQVLPVAQTAGGKGHNVARFLAAADQEVIACGFMGGWAGREMEALLLESGVSPKLTPHRATSRRYTTCLGEGLPGRSLHSPGPTVTPARVLAARWPTWLWHLTAPPSSCSPEACRREHRRTSSRPCIREVAPIPAILDTSGAALAAGVAAKPRMVKVNASELQKPPGIPAAIGQGAVAEDRPEAWWAALRGLAGSTGIAAWWVTLGQYGATGLVDGEPRRSARRPYVR